ncbi:isochorismatase family protein [Streptomyces avermitilis]|uniref:isochorismatase family protein n=1 Tax=Streptomyces avermitilis TaxID=33903 RepID=UPI0033EE8A0F
MDSRQIYSPPGRHPGWCCHLEIGIEPTVRHAADLGYVPVIDTDACGGGNGDAAERSLTALRFGGDARLTTAKVPPP